MKRLLVSRKFALSLIAIGVIVMSVGFTTLGRRIEAARPDAEGANRVVSTNRILHMAAVTVSVVGPKRVGLGVIVSREGDVVLSGDLIDWTQALEVIMTRRFALGKGWTEELSDKHLVDPVRLDERSGYAVVRMRNPPRLAPPRNTPFARIGCLSSIRAGDSLYHAEHDDVTSGRVISLDDASFAKHGGHKSLIRTSIPLVGSLGGPIFNGFGEVVAMAVGNDLGSREIYAAPLEAFLDTKACPTTIEYAPDGRILIKTEL